MKFLVKNLALFIFLSIAVSSLTGCPAVSTDSTNTHSANTQNAQTKPKKNDYPAVPTSIMQTEIEAVGSDNFKLEDEKGKVVLINFWGIWCGPCKTEMPHLIEIQEKYKNRNFEVIGLNVGDENREKESAENIKNFARQMNLNYKLAQADEKFFDEFLKISHFNGVPQSFLIDREGKLNGVYFGAGQNTIEKIKEDVGRIVNAD